MQLATLALPAHPRPLTGIPDPAPVEQQKARAAWHRAMLAVELGDAVHRRGEQGSVGIPMFGRMVRPIGQ